MSLTIGIDIGGTKIAGGLVDEDGNIVASARRTSPASDTDAIETAVEQVVAELRADHEVQAVGVGAAGFIDSKRSTVLFAPNLAWRNEPLKQDLEARIDLPVVVENDANAAAWGEYRFGAGADVKDFVLVAVGTGIGGAVIMNGELHRGAFGIAGEIGHMRLVPEGLICGCGNRGCWEQYASGNALVRETRELAGGGAPGSEHLLTRAGGEVARISGPMITDAAREGDDFALERLRALGKWLGEGIATLAAVLDPAVVVVGGGVSEAGDMLLEPTREHFRANLTGRSYRPELEIRPATLGNQAGLVGVADLARLAYAHA